jgi:hypothetical protein
MKKRFTKWGAIGGLLCGSGIILYAFIMVPGTPGIYELLGQAVLVGILAFAGALTGLFIDWLISVCIRAK